MKTRRVFFYFLLLTGLWFRAALASFPAHAPSFSVHESAYGIRLNGGKRENIQSLQIRLVSYAEPGTRFEVQSFFLKKGKPGELPKVDDTVLFEVTNPHAAYEIKAKPIALSGGTKPTKNKSPKNSKSKQATQVIKFRNLPRIIPKSSIRPLQKSRPDTLRLKIFFFTNPLRKMYPNVFIRKCFKFFGLD